MYYNVVELVRPSIKRRSATINEKKFGSAGVAGGHATSHVVLVTTLDLHWLLERRDDYERLVRPNV